MIIHPLDLNSRLRARPRNFDWAFFVNIALIGMFFLFFGSRFVLSPALVINGGFNVPACPAPAVSYVPGSVVISVKPNEQIFTDTGLVSLSQLDAWLAQKIKTSPDASLLIRIDAQVTGDTIIRITLKAQQAGFKLISTLVEPAPAAPNTFDLSAPPVDGAPPPASAPSASAPSASATSTPTVLCPTAQGCPSPRGLPWKPCARIIFSAQDFPVPCVSCVPFVPSLPVAAAPRQVIRG